MAIDQFTIFIGLNDQIEDAFYYRAGAYYEKGQGQNAIADYTKAIQLDPDYALYYNNRGLAYKYLGEYQRAIQDFQEAIWRDELNAVYYFNRGKAYVALAETETEFYRYIRPLYEKAIADYAKAFQFESDVDIYTRYYSHLVSTCNALDRRSKPGDGTSTNRIFKANC